ncbi:MAG: T9SS type A sorting domain-containing protein [Clostridia bacterium]|nr:T9SS type A sorting domain-containing protein [Clostridia bacterium]
MKIQNQVTRKMKRLISVIIICLMFFVLKTTSAQDAPICTIGNEITTGSTITVPVTAKNFTNLLSTQQQFIFNQTIAGNPVVTKGPTLVGSLGYVLNQPGQITVGWFTWPAATLADDAVVFYLTFTKVNDGPSPVTWDPSYYSYWEYDDYSFLNQTPFSDFYIDGSLTFQGDAPVTILPDFMACAGEQIDIPITVQNFNTIGSVSLALLFNQNVVHFTGCSNTSGFPNLIVGNNIPGKIVLSATASAGITLPFDATLFTLHFDGYLGGTSALEWYDDDGSSCEYQGPPPPPIPGYPTLTDSPQSTYYIDGSVSPSLSTNWTGQVDSDWTKSGNWSCDVPISSSNVTIGVTPNDPVIATDVEVNSLIIESGASLTLAPTATLEVTSTLTNNAGAASLLLESDATSTASLLHNTNDVQATIQRYMPALAANSTVPVYHLVSVPLTQASNPLSGLFMWSYLFRFDAATQAWVALGTPTNFPLEVDQGYMTYKYPGSAKWDTDTIYSFAGWMNNGAFSCNVSYPGVPNNHNLVPNPYPSAIDWNASGWTKNNIDHAIWIWNPDKSKAPEPGYGQYASFIGGATVNWKPDVVNADPIIPVGQAFFVRTNNTVFPDNDPVLSMNNDVRVHGNQEFFKNTEEIVDLLRIKAETVNSSDEIIVRFQDEATNNYDGHFDASKFYGGTYAPQLFSVSDDAEELAINALPYVVEIMEIPVGFSMQENGLVNLAFSSIGSFDPSVTIFLEDVLTGNVIDLRLNPEYNFFHNTDNDPGRFKLIFNETTPVLESVSDNFFCYYADDHVYIQLSDSQSGGANLFIYNVNGQLEFSQIVQSGRSVVNVHDLDAGTHVVRLITDTRAYARKVLVK